MSESCTEGATNSPFVSNNIITNFEYGWYLTYQDLKAQRKTRFNFNDVFGNGKNYYVDDQHEIFDMTGTQGNVSLNPLFVDSSNRDFRLALGSPMIDAGWDAGLLTDINGHVRPFDVQGIDNNGTQPEFDIGAYEYVPEPSGCLLWLLAAITWGGTGRRRVWVKQMVNS